MASPVPETSATNEETVPRELSKAEFVKIVELEPERLGFSVHCRVYSVKRKLCREQLNGDIIRIYEAVVYDDTAAITMTLKGENQISAVKPGDNLTLRNVKVSMHNFHMRMACDRWGLIEKDSEMRIQPKMDEHGSETVPNNVSDQEYERVDDDPAEDNHTSNRSPPRGSPHQGGRRNDRGGRGARRGRGRGDGRMGRDDRNNNRRGRSPRGGPRRGPYYDGPQRGRDRDFRGDREYRDRRGRGRGRGRDRGGRARGRGRRFDNFDRRSPQRY